MDNSQKAIPRRPAPGEYKQVDSGLRGLPKYVKTVDSQPDTLKAVRDSRMSVLVSQHPSDILECFGFAECRFEALNMY